jgi:hypothetical protein
MDTRIAIEGHTPVSGIRRGEPFESPRLAKVA